MLINFQSYFKQDQVIGKIIKCCKYFIVFLPAEVWPLHCTFSGRSQYSPSALNTSPSGQLSSVALPFRQLTNLLQDEPRNRPVDFKHLLFNSGSKKIIRFFFVNLL